MREAEENLSGNRYCGRKARMLIKVRVALCGLQWTMNHNEFRNIETQMLTGT